MLIILDNHTIQQVDDQGTVLRLFKSATPFAELAEKSEKYFGTLGPRIEFKIEEVL